MNVDTTAYMIVELRDNSPHFFAGVFEAQNAYGLWLRDAVKCIDGFPMEEGEELGDVLIPWPNIDHVILVTDA